MVKSNKHIEIVRTNTKILSSLSDESCVAIYDVLQRHFTQVGVTLVESLSDLEALVASSPDLVFLGMEFIPRVPRLGLDDPHKIWLSEYLEYHDIAYTGSGQKSHVLERNKHLAKQRMLDANLRTSAFCVVEQNKAIDRTDVPLDFPLFVKPTNRGGGLGIDSDSVVHTFEQLCAKAHSISTELQSDVLIEKYLPGREFSVAILKDEYSARFLAMPIELIAPPDENGNRLLSGQTKSSNAEQAQLVTDAVLKSKVTDLALAAFDALGARDYGRIDIRLDADGTPHFLEANLIPSLISGYGSFPKACVLNIGLEYEPMIMRIVELGLARQVDKIQPILEPAALRTPVFPTPEVLFKPI